MDKITEINVDIMTVENAVTALFSIQNSKIKFNLSIFISNSFNTFCNASIIYNTNRNKELKF